jgi:predicted permease
MLPALKASGISPLSTLRKTGGSIIAGKNRMRNVLLSGQLIFSILVLSIAAFACRSTFLLAHTDLGFQKDNLHLVSFDLGAQDYQAAEAREFRVHLLERVRSLPSIESASLTSAAPLSLIQGMLGGIRAEETANPDETLPMVPTISVEPGYFETVGIKRLAGRTFTMHDSAKAPKVAIINTVLAEKLWPGQEAIGQRINIQGKIAEVVGLVDIKRHYNITDTHRPLLIVPLEQRHSNTLTLVVRTAEGAPSPMPSITDQVLHLDPNLPLFSQKTMEAHILATPNGLMPFRIGSTLTGLQGGLALLLVCAGIFGQVAFSVSSRTREIGIRIALGSSKLRVIDAITRGVAILTAVSLIIGLGLAVGIGRLLSNFLYSSGQGDALLLAGVGALIIGAVTIACWLPVRRALRVDPMTALRYE